MGIKLVDPEAPSSMEKISLPCLPREEAHRMRRMTRNAADVLGPWALQEMVSLYRNAVDDELRFKILDRILKISIAGKANEEVDPEAPTVDGTVLKDDPLLKLERETEESGTPGVE